MANEDFKAFHEEICQCEGDRSEGTNRTYCYNLCWLKKRIDGFDSEQGYPSFCEVMDYMTENKIPARRQMSTYIAMKVLLNQRGLTEESEKYGRPLVEVRNELQNEYDRQELTGRAKKNWIEYKDICCCAKTLQAETFALDKRVLWTKQQYTRAQLAFVLTFHLKYPLRRVLCTVKYLPKDPSVGNVLDDKTKVITIREHKMQRKYKDPFTFQLDRKMWRLAQLIRRQHKLRGVEADAHLLLSKYWRPMTRNTFCNWMKREMSTFDCCKGKSIGCLAIRRSVISHKRRGDRRMVDLKQIASDCMHSVKANELYRRY